MNSIKIKRNETQLNTNTEENIRGGWWSMSNRLSCVSAMEKTQLGASMPPSCDAGEYSYMPLAKTKGAFNPLAPPISERNLPTTPKP